MAIGAVFLEYGDGGLGHGARSVVMLLGYISGRVVWYDAVSMVSLWLVRVVLVRWSTFGCRCW